MTFLSLADCCRLLAIDPKTFRRWLAAAQLSLRPHPTDGRSKVLSWEHLEQLAHAHRRTLLGPSAQPEASPATSRPEAARASAAEAVVSSSALLSTLLTLLTALQEQLELLLQPQVADPAHPPALGDCVRLAIQPEVRPSAPDKQEPMEETPPRPPARVLPLVEYGHDGHYVLICPEQGRLGFEPDSVAWFAWLESRSSFRFVGREGRFTAHRECERLPNAVWRAHRKLRNHTFNQRLAHTPELTIRVLEQAAATLQAHLK